MRFRPAALQNPFEAETVYDELYDRARFCLVLGISPRDYDEFTDAEVAAFVHAWNDLKQEEEDAQKNAQKKGAR